MRATAHFLPSIILIVAFLARADSLPLWVDEVPRKSSDGHLLISCHGTGPDEDTARQVAVHSCQSQAADELGGGDIAVNTLTIESEKSTSFHSQIVSNSYLTGLICEVENQYKNSDGSIFLECNFDLSKVHKRSIAEKIPDRKATSIETLVQNREELDAALSYPSDHSAGSIIKSQNMSFTISSVPLCDNLLVTGKKPRQIKCESNPVTLVIEPDDTSIIVRAGNAEYLPKTLQLNPTREKSIGSDSIVVYLERK